MIMMIFILKMHLKMLSAKWEAFCFCFNVLSNIFSPYSNLNLPQQKERSYMIGAKHLTDNYQLTTHGCLLTVNPKKYAHGFCFAVLCCGYTLTDFPISIRLTSLTLWQSNDCPSASKATLMNMDKYFMWIHYERLHNHNKAKHNKTVCIFLGIYCNINYYLTQQRWENE